MNISNTKLASYIALAILLAICIFIIYQLGFDSMQESFVTLGTNSNFIIQDETEFSNYSDMIDYNVDTIFPGVTIDNSLNSSLYYKRTNNEDLHIYSNNNKFTWDDATIELYKVFLNNQGISISDSDFNAYVDKLRTIYNQYMILELMSRESNRHKFLTNGALVDGSNNILQPWDESTMTLTGSEYIVKCDGTLKKFTSSSPSSVGTDISLSSLNGLTFIDSVCNPCDALLPPDDVNRYKCKYNLQMQNNIGLSANSIWNKIWNFFSSYSSSNVNANANTASTNTASTNTASTSTSASTSASTTV